MHRYASLILRVFFAPLALVLSSYSQTPTRVHYATFGLGFGARALGMGGAFIAIADDITAMSYNPAGLAQLITPEFSLGVRYGAQALNYSGFSIVETSVRYEHDPYTAAYYRFMWDYIGGVVPFKIGEWQITLGLSRSVKGSDKAQYGYLHHYEEFMLPEDSIITDTYERVRVDNQGSTAMTVFSLGIRPFDFLYLGYNLNLWDSDVTRRSIIQRDESFYFPVPNNNSVSIDSTISQSIKLAVSHDFGLLIKLSNVTAGFVYKTPFRADFTSVKDSVKFVGRLNWPLSFGIGMAVRPSEPLTISIDYNFANWSEGRVVYDDDSQEDYPAEGPCDTYQIRLGGEYLISQRVPRIPIRLGFFLNRLFWNDYARKPIRFKGITCGTGLASTRIAVDIAAVYNFGSYNSVWYIASAPIPVPTKESNWEILASVSYRLWK
jgi:long-chain fatty acid transport protein